MSLAERALTAIHRHALLRDGTRVLIGLSGGADSVALLLLARELEGRGALTVAGAAHLNHQLRGAEADEDEAFCAALAGALDVRFVAERIDVGALARAQKRSLEDAARVARHAFFERAAAALGADVIAVAHTKEDQAETFLLRLLRGAGTRGLAAIHPRVRLPTVAPAAGMGSPTVAPSTVVPEARMGLPTVAPSTVVPEARRWVIRPLLDVARADLRAYLTTRGQAFREDSSNADVTIPRNRIRHELIPALESRFSPRVTDVLAREAALARQDEEFLHAEAIKLAGRIVLPGVVVRIDAAGLHSAPRALSSRVVHMALEQHVQHVQHVQHARHARHARHAGSKAISFDHVEHVLALGPGQAVSLPGQEAVRVGDAITLRPRLGRGPALRSSHRGGSGAASGGGTPFAFSLSIPGEVELGSMGLVVGAELAASLTEAERIAEAEREGGVPTAENRRQRKWVGRGSEVGVATRTLELPLGVRNRRPGDRFRPLGAPGGRKLQDFLVDRKVPRDERDALPLVVDGRDRIVWVVGQSVAEDFRVTDPSQGVLLLKVRRF